MTGRWMAARWCAGRSVATLGGLTLALAAAALLVSAGPAAAEDQAVTVAPGGDVGPVAAQVGDVITIFGADESFDDLAVPGYGVLPSVVVTTIASPASISYTSVGSYTESIGFSYGSVVSPTDVPEQEILASLAAVPLADASLQVQVTEPPPPPEPPAPPAPPAPPPPPPPVAAPPSADQTPGGTQRPVNPRIEEPDARPSGLDVGASAPLPVGGADPGSQPRQSSEGMNSTTRGGDGFEVAASVVDTPVAAGFDDLPMALGLPSLLAVLSICVLGAGVARLQVGAPRIRR